MTGAGGEGLGASGGPKATVRSYRDLEVWQKAMDLVEACYRVTAGFPKSESYGLASQLQRAAVSVPANIAEGHARQHTREFLQYLSFASGSLAEVETHLLIAGRLGLVGRDELNRVLDQATVISKMLSGLRKSLQRLNRVQIGAVDTK